MPEKIGDYRCDMHDCNYEYDAALDRYICPKCFTNQCNQALISNKLVEKYDEVYRDGEEKFWTFLPVEERITILQEVDLYGKICLDIGCGTGDFAAWMATAGAQHVVGIDASTMAIHQASKKYRLKNLYFEKWELADFCEFEKKKFDVVSMVGVIEHTEQPGKVLRMASGLLSGRGLLAVSCPNHANPRGVIWVTLRTLFHAPMSLTDKWDITHAEMKLMAHEAGLKYIKSRDCDFSWGNGDRFFQDYNERLPKVFPDMDRDRINQLLVKLPMLVGTGQGFYTGEGANKVYFFRKS